MQIVSVKDSSTGAKLHFETYPEYFTAKSNSVEVVYNYQPDYAQAFNSSLDVAKYCVTPRLIALGAVARYYLFEGLLEESNAWNNMFERAVLIAQTPKHSTHINKRSWF